MRVLLTIDSLGVGGAERHVADLARTLAQRGYEAVVACTADGPCAAGLDHVRVIGERLVKRRFCERYAAGLRDVVREVEPDVVHAHLFASATAAAAAVEGTPIPLVITEQTEAPWRAAPERRLSARAHARAAHAIAVSTRIARGLRMHEGVPPRRISVIPNTVTEDHEPE